mmetsp:Transcript_3775/g.9496  ORF Transcript_3775/g.9496 Transcript_3775/m.9496 type:complete len:1193 (+) Transcript_3775:152-3730(+)
MPLADAESTTKRRRHTSTSIGPLARGTFVVSLSLCIQGPLSVAAQTPAGYSRFVSHWIIGRDQAGLTAVTATNRQLASTVAACAAACDNDRGCNSFEFGVGRSTAGLCRLSYDTRTSVASIAGAYAPSSEWDFYERTQPFAPLAGFASAVPDSWIAGVNDIATYTNATREACAALCLHHPACRSFEWSNGGPPCEDSTISGFAFGTGNTAQHASCPRLAAVGACNHTTLGFRIRDRCRQSCQNCPPTADVCMLSHFAAGDSHSDGTVLSLASQTGWAYYSRVTASQPCPPGTASETGSAASQCTSCPPDTFSSISRTRCVACPSGYVSNASSASVHSCVRDVAAVGLPNSSSIFQEGELWIGNYHCSNGVINSGNARLELLITDVAANGSVSLIRRFINSYTRGSYLMHTSAVPSINDTVTLTAGDWLEQPDNVTIHGGLATLTTLRVPMTGSFSFEHGAARFTGTVCDGHFSLTRACEVSPGPATFQIGEQWIGEYQCEDTVEPGRTDVRRLDLTVTGTNGSHVRVVSTFTHQDVLQYPGSGSYNMSGNFANTTHRLHLTTPGVDAWIRRPSSRWVTSDLNGAITDDKLVFFGTKGNDPACGCTGVSANITALDRATLTLVTRNVGGVCTEVVPVPCEHPYSLSSTMCWNFSANPWCFTTGACPNPTVFLNVNGAPQPMIGCAVQTCSAFSARRICSPVNYTSFCECTGQIDGQGRGGSCQEYPDDLRGAWCYVSNRCVDAGPANATGSQGLFWANCAGVSDCQMSPWSSFGPCTIPGCNVSTANVNGTQIRSRSVLSPPQNGGAPCGPTIEVRDCQAICTDPFTMQPTSPTAAPASATQGPPTVQPTSVPTTSEFSNATFTRPPGSGGRRRRTVFHGDGTELSLEVLEACKAIVGSTAVPTINVFITESLITVQATTPNIATIVAHATACQLCLPSGICLVPSNVGGLVCAAVAPSCANVRCTNGGLCVLARQDCSDPLSARTVPSCVCNSPVTSGGSCAFGPRCESTFECAQAGRHCHPSIGGTATGAPCRTVELAAGTNFTQVGAVMACVGESAPTISPATSAEPTAGASGGGAGGTDGAASAIAAGILVAVILLLLCVFVTLLAYLKRRRSSSLAAERNAYVNPVYGNQPNMRRESATEADGLYAELPVTAAPQGEGEYLDVAAEPPCRDGALANETYMELPLSSDT